MIVSQTSNKLNPKRVITLALIVMMYVVVLLSVIELGWVLVTDIISPPMFILEIEELLEVLNLFLLVLIALELLDSISAYMKDNVIHVEVVLEVAMIAIARKVIILDFDKVNGLSIIAIGVVILALSAGYYVVKKFYKDTHRMGAD